MEKLKKEKMTLQEIKKIPLMNQITAKETKVVFQDFLITSKVLND